MRSRTFLLSILLLSGLFLAVPNWAATAQTTESIVIPVKDSRSGDGPCGFTIHRDLEGSVSITPSLDDDGNLVLTVEDVDLHGVLSNPDNGQSVEIQWVQQNGSFGFDSNGSSTNIHLQLTGTVNRGYDTADSELALHLPLDGAETTTFVPEGRNIETWAHVCATLS